MTEGIVVFGMPSEFKFHKESLERKDNKELIRKILSSLLNCKVKVSFVLTESNSTVITKKEEPKPSTDSNASDIITSALDVFKGSRVIRQD